MEYSKHLHEEHNSYPTVPEKMVIEKNLMAVYQKRVMEDLKSYPSNSKKLQVLTLETTKYLVQYKNLQLYVKRVNQDKG